MGTFFSFFFIYPIMDKGAKIVSSAVLGLDMETVLVAGEVYVVTPPTIARICGAAYWLADLRGEGKDTLSDLLACMRDIDKAAKALSWFVAGDETLYGKFREARLQEVVEGIAVCLGMVSTANFMMLSALSRSVCGLTANTKA